MNTKTIEEKKAEIQLLLLTDVPLKGNARTYTSMVTIENVGNCYESYHLRGGYHIDLTKQLVDEFIIYLYWAVGLEARDAVDAEREIAEEYLARLKAERARSGKLVEALEYAQMEIGHMMRGEPYSGTAPFIIDAALAAHKEGGGEQ